MGEGVRGGRQHLTLVLLVQLKGQTVLLSGIQNIEQRWSWRDFPKNIKKLMDRKLNVVFIFKGVTTATSS